MEKNAWHIAKLLVDTNDGTAVLHERTKVCLLNDKQELLFFNKEYSLKYHGALLNCFPSVG